jgi:hypothetical protein
MLRSRSQWTDTEAAALRWTYWTAIDLDNGARLTRSAGQGKGGLNKYVLLVTGKPYADIQDMYAERMTWTKRAFIRAWHDAEAVELANIRLAKMLQKA